MNSSCEICKVSKTKKKKHLCSVKYTYSSVLLETAETDQHSAIKFHDRNKTKFFSNQIPL